ncbi:hypothetical protein MPH_08976 [Macrophomina phaseolina MS6]|uniref:Uncharacterized protein n=1 Tax=Macrophomina phaseolina (strain MS6) TaxID=1126212 RepID=K2RUG7_MACPH|nr:hypothetical protein MPH_08976 [Macrophomina phaseolina MS6]
MSFPLSTRCNNSLLFTIPSRSVARKIQDDAEYAIPLRKQLAGKILCRRIEVIASILSRNEVDIDPIPDQRILKVTLYLPPQTFEPYPLRQAALPERPKPIRYHSPRTLPTIPEHEELDTFVKNQDLAQVSKTTIVGHLGTNLIL